MLRQYRHPVGEHLWELPAGLRDADGEPPLETAQRELAEEVAARRRAVVAADHLLHTPGFCDELVLVYLAEGLSTVDRPEGFIVEHEELDMTVERVPLDRRGAAGLRRHGPQLAGGHRHPGRGCAPVGRATQLRAVDTAF